MKGKSAFDAPRMKENRANVPKEGKKIGESQSQSTLAERDLGIRKKVDTWIKTPRFQCNKIPPKE